MDAILAKRREIFFNNLVLLGLDKLTFEKKYGITFHKDMFALPNKKGFEIVTHFLFSKLNFATGKDYNIPWPLISKEHDRMFQRTSYSHLMNFSQENFVKFPRIVPSLLSTFGGDRFYEVYLAFSGYVLYKTITKNGNVKLLSMPSASRESFSTVKDILQLSTVLHMKKFKNIETISYIHHCIWQKFVKNLEECLGKLKHLLKSNEELLKEKKNTILSIYCTAPEENFNISKMIERSFEYLKPVKKQRKVLDKFFATEQKYWQYLSSEVGDNVENEFLNGQDYSIYVTNILPEEYCKTLKSVGYLSSNENGRLSILRFIKMFMVYLTYIMELLKKANLSELHKTCYVENASSIEDDLNSIKKLNNKLSDEVIPSVEKGIERFKIKFFQFEMNSKVSCDQFCSSLPVLSFDIKTVNERNSQFDSNLENIFNSLCIGKQLYNDQVFMPKSNPVCHSSIGITDRSLTSSNFSFLNPTDLIKGTATSNSCSSGKLEEKNLVEHSKLRDISVINHPSSSKINISSLDDMEFTPSSHFKMRASWLHEESLNTMTLPDISFDE